MNKDANPRQITAVGRFQSADRRFRWFTIDCNGQPSLLAEQRISAPDNSAILFVDSYTIGQKKYMVQQVDNGCVSAMSPPVTATIKPCQLAPYGCNQPLVNHIEDNSCNPSAQNRSDYHFYYTEKYICTSNCDLEAVWRWYKSSVTNQAIVLSDQIPYTGSFVKDFGFSKLLFDKGDYTSPIIDCQTLYLPRITTFVWSAGIKVIPPLSYVKKLQDVCTQNPSSYSDRIFIRVDENTKSVINYTHPDHALHPGKVTRRLVAECGKVKVMTFGEGTTVFPNNDCGRIVAYINQHWGKSMFENVDERVVRAYANRQVIPRPSGTMGIPNRLLVNKNWKIKDFKIKYNESDSLYTFYTYGDGKNFFGLNKLNMSFDDSSRYIGSDVSGRVVEGTWSYDSLNSKLTTDTSYVHIISQTDSTFTTKQLLPVLKDSTLVSAECYITFFHKEISDIIYTFNGNGQWSETSNWERGLKPPTNINYGVVIYINPTGANAECVYNGNLTISRGAKLIVNPLKKFRVNGTLTFK